MNDNQLKAYHANKNRKWKSRIHDNRFGWELDKTESKPILPLKEKKWEEMNVSEKHNSNMKILNKMNEDTNEFIKSNVYQVDFDPKSEFHDRTFGCKHCDKKYRSNASDRQRPSTIMGKQVKHLVNHIKSKHGIKPEYGHSLYNQMVDVRPTLAYRDAPLNDLKWKLSDMETKGHVTRNNIEDGMKGISQKGQERQKRYSRR